MATPENIPEEPVEEVTNIEAEPIPEGLEVEIPPGITPLEKPTSNIFTLLLLISSFFVLISIYLVCYELNKFYGVTFGGLLGEPATPVAEVEIPE